MISGVSVEVGAEKTKMNIPGVVGGRRLKRMFNGKKIESMSALVFFYVAPYICQDGICGLP